MDIENGSGRGGFPHLAHKIAAIPDYETFVFRKFDRLSARNLLHFEGKLAYLEWKLDRADEQASLSPDNETLRSIHVWEAFEENAKGAGRPEHDRMKIAEEIRETLKDYQEALLRQNRIASLEAPKKRALRVAQRQSHNVVNEPFAGAKKLRPVLGGLASQRLHEENHGDLVAIRQQADKDLLSRFLQDHWIFKVQYAPPHPFIFLTMKTTKMADDTEYINESHVAWVAATASTVIAAILLVGAIIVLRLLKQENAQLGVIAMFMVLFAISVGLLTTARRAEIFASTAAYAAVLVVFISSTPAGASACNGPT